MLAEQYAQSIYSAATPVLRISNVGGRQWKRNVAKGARIGPWYQGHHHIIDSAAWHKREACLYLVSPGHGEIGYVGISRNRLKDRWRTSPAFDAETMQRLPQDQIFHSQCWKHVERISLANPGSTFEVRAIWAGQLCSVLERLGPPLSAFTVLRDDGESVVASVERWICNNRTARLASWNVAMTGK
jgi:hypothetical protein